MASTINGLIADENDKTSWISNAEWDSYSKLVRETGWMIIGHRTYNILTTQPEFAEFKDVKIIVVAHQDFSALSPNHTVAHSPAEALELCKDQPAVVIAGGGALNSAFLAENLIDELYLDLEPAILGKGVPFSYGRDFTRELTLLEVNKISDDEIQLHYKVAKD